MMLIYKFIIHEYFFSFQILPNAKVARFEGIELYNMGQQENTSMYPIHFHRVFDATGYYARQLSIHHCFSKCVTIHATMNLLVITNINIINIFVILLLL